MAKLRELDKQIAQLFRQLADLYEQRAAAEDETPQPSEALSGPECARRLGVSPDTVWRRARDGKPVNGFFVEKVSARLFRLLPVQPVALPKPESKLQQRLRVIEKITRTV